MTTAPIFVCISLLAYITINSTLTRALVGGGAIYSPLPFFFCDSGNKAARSAAKLSVPSLASIPHTLSKKKKKWPRSWWVGHEWRQSDVMFCRFRPKQGLAGIAVTDTAFKLESNVFYEKYVKLMGLSSCYLEILKISIFFSKIWKFSKLFQNLKKKSNKFSKNRNIC